MKFLTTTFLLIATITTVFAQWSPIADYPSTPTDGAISFTIGNHGYTGAGIADNKLHKYDPDQNSWTYLADIPSPGNHLGWAFSFTVNGKAYIGGGSYASASDLTADVYEFDPADTSFTQKASFPGGDRDGFFSFSIGNKGYVGGGFDGQYLLNDFYEFDPANNQWKQLPDFPGGPVIFSAAFVVDGKAYVGTGGQATQISGLWMYDPAANNWTQKAAFGGGERQTVAAFSIGSYGYFAGGMTNYDTTYQDVWRYDPGNNTWTQLSHDLPDERTAWSTVFVIETEAYFGLGVRLPDFSFSRAFYKADLSGTVGVGKESLQNFGNIKLWPNPAQGYFYLDIPGGSDVSVLSIYNAHGKQIQRHTVTANQNIISTTGWPAGMYFLRLQRAGGSDVVKKVLIPAQQ